MADRRQVPAGRLCLFCEACDGVDHAAALVGAVPLIEI
jgi:hypothetical protein